MVTSTNNKADSATKTKKKGDSMANLKKQIKSTLSFMDRAKQVARTTYRSATIFAPAVSGLYLLLFYRSDMMITVLAIALLLIGVYNVITLSWKVESVSSVANTEQQ